MFKLASLFVDIKADQSPFDKAIAGVHSKLTGASIAVGTFVGNIASGIANAAASFAGLAFEKTIKSASNLNETLSKTQTVFGDSAKSVIDQAEQMASTFGLPKQAMLDAGSVLGLFAKGAGQSGDQAAAFSNKMTKLAADAMSFYNVPFDEALHKIQSGLSGEAEPLRAFGVFLNEDAVAAEAMAMGLSKSGKNLDEGTKIMARASLITKGMASAQGDLERTFDGTENQSRKFWGTLDNLAQSIGSALLPAFNDLLSVGNTAISGLTAGWESSKATFAEWVEGVRSAMATVGVIWRNLPDEWAIVRIKIAEGVQNIIAWFEILPENVGRIAGWIGRNWYELIVDGINATMTAFENFGSNLSNLGKAIGEWLSNPTEGFHFEWTPLLKGFQATAEALPEMVKPAFVSMQNDIDKIGEQIAQRETARAKGVVETAKASAATAQNVATQAKAKEKEFKSELVDSAEFARKLWTNALGGDDTPKKQLAAAEKTAQHTEEIAAKIGKPTMAVLG